MKQQYAHRKVKKRNASMQIHRKRLRNFLNNYTVDHEMFLTYRIQYQVNWRRVLEAVSGQAHNLEVGGSIPSSATNKGERDAKTKSKTRSTSKHLE